MILEVVITNPKAKNFYKEFEKLRPYGVVTRELTSFQQVASIKKALLDALVVEEGKEHFDTHKIKEIIEKL
jgi:hypothetical protein